MPNWNNTNDTGAVTSNSCFMFFSSLQFFYFSIWVSQNKIICKTRVVFEHNRQLNASLISVTYPISKLWGRRSVVYIFNLFLEYNNVAPPAEINTHVMQKLHVPIYFLLNTFFPNQQQMELEYLN